MPRLKALTSEPATVAAALPLSFSVIESVLPASKFCPLRPASAASWSIWVRT